MSIRSLLPAKLNDVWFALDARQVREIVGARAWVPIPHASAQVPGVLAWRGKAVAVFDVALLIQPDLALRAGSRRPRTIVMESGDATLALPVDSVREVFEVDEQKLRSPHVTRMPHSHAETEVLGTVVPLLDIEPILKQLLEAGHER